MAMDRNRLAAFGLLLALGLLVVTVINGVQAASPPAKAPAVASASFKNLQQQQQAYAKRCHQIIGDAWRNHPHNLIPEATVQATFALTVNASGQFLNLRLIKPSSNAAFNEEVLKAIRKIGSFPPAPNKTIGTMTLSSTLLLTVFEQQVDVSEEPVAPGQPSTQPTANATAMPSNSAPSGTLAQEVFHQADKSVSPASVTPPSTTRPMDVTLEADAVADYRCNTDLATYKNTIAERIRQRMALPAFVARLSVGAELMVDQQGHLLSAQLSHPSGDSRLDRELMKSVWESAPFYALPGSCRQVKQVTFNVGYEVGRTYDPYLNQVADKLSKRRKQGYP